MTTTTPIGTPPNASRAQPQPRAERATLPPAQSPDMGWRSSISQRDGCNEGSCAAPERAMRGFNVSSAAQVPYILHELHTKGGPIRLNFPTTTDPKVRADQVAIRDFLRNHHGKEPSELQHELVKLLERSNTFQAQMANAEFKQKFPSAKAWVEAHLKDIKTGSGKLSVSDVVSVAKESSAEVVQGVIASLDESVSKGRGAVLVVPEGATSETEFVKALSKLSGKKPAITAKMQVWVTDGDLGVRECAQDSPEVKQMTLQEYLQQVAKAKKETLPVSTAAEQGSTRKDGSPSEDLEAAAATELAPVELNSERESVKNEADNTSGAVAAVEESNSLAPLDLNVKAEAEVEETSGDETPDAFKQIDSQENAAEHLQPKESKTEVLEGILEDADPPSSGDSDVIDVEYRMLDPQPDKQMPDSAAPRLLGPAASTDANNEEIEIPRVQSTAMILREQATKQDEEPLAKEASGSSADPVADPAASSALITSEDQGQQTDSSSVEVIPTEARGLSVIGTGLIADQQVNPELESTPAVNHIAVVHSAEECLQAVYEVRELWQRRNRALKTLKGETLATEIQDLNESFWRIWNDFDMGRHLPKGRNRNDPAAVVQAVKSFYEAAKAAERAGQNSQVIVARTDAEQPSGDADGAPRLAA